jgi:hypothetical protein
MIVENLFIYFLFRVAMLARDSIVYFIVILGLCASVRGLLVLTSTVRYLLACLILDIVSNIDNNLTIQIAM